MKRLNFFGGAFLSLLFVLFISFNALSQTFNNEGELIEQANKLFETESYIEAKPLFSQLLSLHPEVADYNYKFGVCKLYTDADKNEALTYLEAATNIAGVSNEAFFFLGRGYHLNFKFNEAIAQYNKYKSGLKGAADTKDVDRQIAMCQNGKQLFDPDLIFFPAEKNKTIEGEFFRKYDQRALKGKIIPKTDNFKSKYDKKINDNSLMFVSQLSRELYFSGYGEEGATGSDIYRVYKLPNGEWAIPQRLPDVINTQFDEAYAFMHPEGDTLYFSSKGHNTMGGYDIFMSVFDRENVSWSKPVNLKYPYCTPDDDIFYALDYMRDFSYFATRNFTEPGKMTVYKVSNSSDKEELAIVSGEFTMGDTLLTKTQITVTDKESGELVGIYNSNKLNGKYLLALPKGKVYTFNVEPEGFVAHKMEIKVPSKFEAPALNQKMVFSKSNEGEKVILTNGFDGAGSLVEETVTSSYSPEQLTVQATQQGKSVMSMAQFETYKKEKKAAAKEYLSTLASVQGEQLASSETQPNVAEEMAKQEEQAKEEAAKKKAEEEEKARLAAEQAKKVAEEKAKQEELAKVEAAKKKTEEEEKARIAAEEAKKVAEEKARQEELAKVEAAKKKAEEEEKARIAAEQAKKVAEEKARQEELAKVEAAKKKTEEEEKARLAAEEAKKVAEEKAKQEELAKVEAAKKKSEEEEKAGIAAEQAKKVAEEKARQEELAKVEAAKKKTEEEEKARIAAEQAKKVAEEKARQEELAKAEAAKKKAEEKEKARLAAEQAKKVAEEKARQEELARAEAAKKKAEKEEKARIAAEQTKKVAEEKAKQEELVKAEAAKKNELAQGEKPNEAVVKEENYLEEKKKSDEETLAAHKAEAELKKAELEQKEKAEKERLVVLEQKQHELQNIKATEEKALAEHREKEAAAETAMAEQEKKNQEAVGKLQSDERLKNKVDSLNATLTKGKEQKLELPTTQSVAKTEEEKRMEEQQVAEHLKAVEEKKKQEQELLAKQEAEHIAAIKRQEEAIAKKKAEEELKAQQLAEKQEQLKKEMEAAEQAQKEQAEKAKQEELAKAEAAEKKAEEEKVSLATEQTKKEAEEKDKQEELAKAQEEKYKQGARERKEMEKALIADLKAKQEAENKKKGEGEKAEPKQMETAIAEEFDPYEVVLEEPIKLVELEAELRKIDEALAVVIAKEEQGKNAALLKRINAESRGRMILQQEMADGADKTSERAQDVWKNRVTVSAKKEEVPSYFDKTDLRQHEGVHFKIEVVLKSAAISDLAQEKITASGEVLTPPMDEFVVYTTGYYKTLAEITLAKSDLRDKGVQDYRVIAYHNGEEISLSEVKSIPFAN